MSRQRKRDTLGVLVAILFAGSLVLLTAAGVVAAWAANDRLDDLDRIAYTLTILGSGAAAGATMLCIWDVNS